jgi:small-conductance mechanosensitive channel
MTNIDWTKTVGQFITEQRILHFVSAALILIVGIFLSRRADSAISRLKHLDLQQRILFTKIAKYGVLTLAAAAALSQLGFDLKVLLGAAGVLTVAVGFAAQTSASNLISGIFLMVEKPFVIGDIVEVAGTKGEVLSIDLLSCKIRMFNNVMVRIPNETMVKSNITNLSYFPVRRVDFKVGVGYASDMRKVRELLVKAANAHPLCMNEPEPVFTFENFGDSSINVTLQVWTLNENVGRVQNDVFSDIKKLFEENGIEIPFPTRTLVQTQG